MLKLRHGISATRKLLKSRYFAISAFFLLCSAIVFVGVIRVKTIRIMDEGVVRVAQTTETSLDAILNAQGIECRPEDRITFTGFDGNYGSISIERAFPILVTADGQTRQQYVLDGTVTDVLENIDLSLGEQDIINVSTGKYLEENDHIVIQRVSVETRQVAEPIPHETEVRPSSVVLAGKVSVLQKGANGQKIATFTDRYVDGKLVETALLGEEVVQEPVREVQLKGTASAQSPMTAFSGTELDDTGRPSNAIRVLENQVATAYTARAGARTSTGRVAQEGYVAVNPNVIPYGTRLFIETSNGKMIYGYAVAADTGGAMMSGGADIDLYFDTQEECIRFGRRTVNVYILP